MRTPVDTEQVRATIPGRLARAIRQRAEAEGRSYSATIAVVLDVGDHALVTGRDTVAAMRADRAAEAGA